MQISELIKQLERAWAKYGDMPVEIESSYGQYAAAKVSVAGSTRNWKKGDMYPNYTGDLYFLLSSDPHDASQILPVKTQESE